MPRVRSILNPLWEHPSFRAACNAVTDARSEIVLSGLTCTAKALLVAGFAHQLCCPVLVLTADNELADRLRKAASTFLTWLEGEAGAVSSLPAFDCSPYEGRSPHAEILERRAAALWKIARGDTRVLFVPLAAALGRFREPSYYRALALELKTGDELSLSDLTEHLAGVGYENRDPVEEPGQFSVRGGIIDVFPPEAEWPFRLEFFGDQLESIRQFDPSTQRSRKPVPSALLLPLAENRRSPRFFQALIRVLGGRDRQSSRRDVEPPWAPEYSSPFPGWEFFAPLAETRPLTLLSLFTEAVAPGFPIGSRGASPASSPHRGAAAGIDGPAPSSRGSAAPLLVWDEPLDRRGQLQQIIETWAEGFDKVRDVVPPRPLPGEIFLTEAEFLKSIEGAARIGLKELSVGSSQLSAVSNQLSIEADPSISARMSPSSLLMSGGQIDRKATTDEGRSMPDRLATDNEPCPTGEFTLLTQPPPKFHGAVRIWIEDVRARAGRGETVAIVVPAGGKVDRLREILNEYELPFAEAETLRRGVSAAKDEGSKQPAPQEIEAARDAGSGEASQRSVATFPQPLIITRGELEEGVYFPELHLLIESDSDLFGGFAWGISGRREKSAVTSFVSGLSDLKVGDYVVHVDHGIGLYGGLKQLEVEGQSRDFMLLTYQEDARLYVPLERLDLIEKYRSSGDGVRPTLDRLGGATWARTKTRVKRALRDMAEELLRLYAQRKMSGGVAYSPDTPWQNEFEDAFEFEETPDQLTALTEIKRDLESPEPMDRLLCGDVGYGKTELAMRAAFKVVQDGRQVSVLAPTTVLAFQHYTTFRQRMASFPIRIEMLSRFRSAAEQKAVIAETAAGKVDILIGTHRLLSKDVSFRDLGLLVVDEEQRFGVAAKEKMKKLRSNVEVLTMSATPIPRTLHMSLGGLRDLSVIETPPRGRLAIQTVVAPFSDRLIQSAILQEMERQGQVYFVHNRVESIFSIAALIQRLVPTARIGVGHGQMGEKELERVMLRFIQNQYDVLVSTAIIENGLDIPRANTMIVNHADRFGLADLYQLRGRVGRSNRRAYAYFLIPAEESLTPLAKRRLAALKEFSDLGAGFRLAALDLELRGAGNLLGGEQSGHLNAIGLDLYLKMLEQTVDELKGTPAKPEVHTTLNLGLDIKIPNAYIAEESQRLRMYKRISGLARREERLDLEAELVDRYGPVPDSVSTLLDYALLKSAAEQLLVYSVERKADEVWIRFHDQAPVDAERLTRFIRQHKEASLRPDGTLRFRLMSRDGDLLQRLRYVLQELEA